MQLRRRRRIPGDVEGNSAYKERQTLPAPQDHALCETNGTGIHNQPPTTDDVTAGIRELSWQLTESGLFRWSGKILHSHWLCRLQVCDIWQFSGSSLESAVYNLFADSSTAWASERHNSSLARIVSASQKNSRQNWTLPHSTKSWRNGKTHARRWNFNPWMYAVAVVEYALKVCVYICTRHVCFVENSRSTVSRCRLPPIRSTWVEGGA